MTTLQQARAHEFHALHTASILVLPNAWDAASASLVVAAGAKAIATSSAAVSWAHGYADGEQLPPAAHLASVREIVRVATVPVSVDIEGGYADAPDAVAQLVREIIEAGAVGINIEDGASAPALLAAKITAARTAARQLDIDLFINARTDVYLRGLVAPEHRVAETITRARLYQEAGADGLFVPGLADPLELRTISAAVGLPVNVLALPGMRSVQELAEHGARRLSVGCALYEAALAKLREATNELLQSGRFDSLFKDAVSYQEMNGLLRC